MGLLEITPAAPKATCSPRGPLHSDAQHAALFTMKRPHCINRASEVPLYINAGHLSGSPLSGPPEKPPADKDVCGQSSHQASDVDCVSLLGGTRFTIHLCILRRLLKALPKPSPFSFFLQGTVRQLRSYESEGRLAQVTLSWRFALNGGSCQHSQACLTPSHTWRLSVH